MKKSVAHVQCDLHRLYANNSLLRSLLESYFRMDFLKKEKKKKQKLVSSLLSFVDE